MFFFKISTHALPQVVSRKLEKTQKFLPLNCASQGVHPPLEGWIHWQIPGKSLAHVLGLTNGTRSQLVLEPTGGLGAAPEATQATPYGWPIQRPRCMPIQWHRLPGACRHLTWRSQTTASVASPWPSDLTRTRRSLAGWLLRLWASQGQVHGNSGLREVAVRIRRAKAPLPPQPNSQSTVELTLVPRRPAS